MKVSKRSWHYRLVNWVETDHNYVPTNLCTHFWAVVGALLFTTAFFVVVPLVAVGGVGYFYGYQVWVQHTLGAAIVHGVIASVLLVGFIIWAIAYSATKSNALTAAWKKRPHPTESLGWQYVSAKKQRVCPIIEVVE